MAANLVSELVVDENFSSFNGGPFTTLRFTDGGSVTVSFTGETPSEIEIDYIGVGLTENFSVNNVVNVPGSYSFDVAFTSGVLGDAVGAGIQAITFVPEPSSTLLMALAGLGLVGCRRR